MEPVSRFENYPISTVVFSNFVSLSIYGLGLFIMSGTGTMFLILYLVFILGMEYRLLSRHCPGCYYWGKTCGFGKGKISSIFFKKGDSSRFCHTTMTWKDMIPDIMVTLVPLVAGLVLLIIDFNLLLLFALFLMVVFTTSGNGFIRGKLTCNHCKQAELGCPAEALFRKKSSP